MPFYFFPSLSLPPAQADSNTAASAGGSRRQGGSGTGPGSTRKPARAAAGCGSAAALGRCGGGPGSWAQAGARHASAQDGALAGRAVRPSGVQPGKAAGAAMAWCGLWQAVPSGAGTRAAGGCGATWLGWRGSRQWVAPGVARIGVRSARGSRRARRGGAREQVLCTAAQLGCGHREPARVWQWRGRARAGGAEAEQASARVARGADM
jgi:hypothetical protein